MTSASLNGTELADAVPEALVLQVLRPLAGARRHVSVEAPGRAGSWIFPEEPGDRTIALVIDLQADGFDTRRAAVRNLAGWADVGTTTRLVIDDEPDRYHDAILDDAPEIFEWLTYTEPIRLAFRCNPYAWALVADVETFTASGSPDSGTFTADDELDAFPVVEITPTNGTVATLTWTLNGDAISFAETIAEDATVTISSISDTVTEGESGDVELSGAFNPAAVAMSTVSGTFGRVVGGSNSWALEWTGTATEITVSITWRERFR